VEPPKAPAEAKAEPPKKEESPKVEPPKTPAEAKAEPPKKEESPKVEPPKAPAEAKAEPPKKEESPKVEPPKAPAEAKAEPPKKEESPKVEPPKTPAEAKAEPPKKEESPKVEHSKAPTDTPAGSRIPPKAEVAPDSGSGQIPAPIIQSVGAKARAVGGDSKFVNSLGVTLTFETARRSITLGELRSIQPGYTFVSQNPVNSPIEIRANGTLVGYGKLVSVENNIGVQITELV
jgi:flagellar motor switch/type III secretory pathway protein FliN